MPFLDISGERFHYEEAGPHDGPPLLLSHSLGTTLGMRVLAEGVETAEQVELAQPVGCTYAQGHRVSAPLDAAVLGALLVQGRRLTGRQVLPP